MVDTSSTTNVVCLKTTQLEREQQKLNTTSYLICLQVVSHCESQKRSSSLCLGGICLYFSRNLSQDISVSNWPWPRPPTTDLSSITISRSRRHLTTGLVSRDLACSSLLYSLQSSLQQIHMATGGIEMLFACTYCHKRYKMEELSAIQQLCKVSSSDNLVHQ